MPKSVSKIVAASDPRGEVELVRHLGQEAKKSAAGAIILLGSLTPKNTDPKKYGDVLNALAEANLPAFYLPGPEDVPFAEFLREAANFEIVYPHVRGVHATFAMAPRYIVVSGMGGDIDDNPKAVREESDHLRYPGWEVEYRLKFLQELKDYQKLFLFTTPPEHKGLRERGSVTLAELIKTYNPHFVVAGGQEQKAEVIGKSLLIRTGSIAEGKFTLLDFRSREVTPGTLGQPAKAA